MKGNFFVSVAVSLTVIGMFGCSTVSLDDPFSEEDRSSGKISYVSVAEAQEILSKCRHTVVNSWQRPDSTVSTIVDTSIQESDFAVNADVLIEDESSYTVASAGINGSFAAWKVQIEDGAIVYSWRSQADGKWFKFKTSKRINKKVLNTVRVEHVGEMVIIFANGEIIEAFKHDGNKNFKIDGDLTIGSEAEKVDIERVDEIEDSVGVDSVYVLDESSSKTVELSASKWIAEWSFDSSNVGLDVTGNGHDAVIGEGSVNAENGIALFDGKSGFSVLLDEDIAINQFVVEARVFPTQFGTMQNIIVAEPPGRGVDGWQLRIDEGVLTVHLRDTDKDGDDWSIFPGQRMALDEWCVIRMERSADSVKLFQNGILTVSAAYQGDLTQMAYDWSIGFDGMQQNFHDRYFVGKMDYVRFGVFSGFSQGVLASDAQRLLVAWEFNEPKFIGLDRMANNSTHYEVGNPKIVDTTIVLDGMSGLQVALSKVFKRNTFAIETRVKPAKFGPMQNIFVAEPPGRYGDGWIVRLDDGVLTVHFRDENSDGTEWNVLSGEKLALNEWTKIRIERTADSVVVFQNGKRSAGTVAKGDVSQLGYNLGIGYDAMMQAKHDRFFDGEIDYIRYYGI